MKKMMMRAAQAVFLMTMAMLTLSSCSDKEDEKLPDYTKFVNIDITRCERVGSVLMIDFTVTSVQESSQGVKLSYPTVTDNNGKEYERVVGGIWNDRTAIAMADNRFDSEVFFTLEGKGTAKGHLKVFDFDSGDQATQVNAKIKVSIDNQQLADKPYRSTQVDVVDNRVKEHGVQTNDTKMAYTVTRCVLADGNVDVYFTITNNTGSSLRNLFLGSKDKPVYDNLGNRYNTLNAYNICIEGDDDWSRFVEIDLNAGASIKGIFRQENIKGNPQELTFQLKVTAENYTFEDEIAQFLSIPITAAQ